MSYLEVDMRHSYEYLIDSSLEDEVLFFQIAVNGEQKI